MNITIDPTIPGALGSFGYDDEGTPAAPRDAVRNGTWVGVLAGRDSAAVAGLDYAGSVRAEGWARLPMVRMTNVGLEPGPHTFDEIIAATDDGIYMETNRSWSIDDRRLNFQFGTEVGYEVKNGQLGRLLRNPTYTGIGPQFWSSMDMLSSETRRLGHAELREGSARPDRPHGPSRRAGPVPQRPRRGSGMSRELDLAGLPSAVEHATSGTARRRGRGIGRPAPARPDAVRQLGDPPERRRGRRRRRRFASTTTGARRRARRPSSASDDLADAGRPDGRRGARRAARPGLARARAPADRRPTPGVDPHRATRPRRPGPRPCATSSTAPAGSRPPGTAAPITGTVRSRTRRASRATGAASSAAMSGDRPRRAGRPTGWPGTRH